MDEHVATVPVGEPLREQEPEMLRPPDATAGAGGGGEAEQVGNRARSDDSRPESSDCGIVWGVSRCRLSGEERADPGTGECGHPALPRLGGEDLRSARVWRGVRVDGRTVISTEEPGRCGGHAIYIQITAITNKRVPLSARKDSLAGPAAR
jgi:hypothetical protein